MLDPFYQACGEGLPAGSTGWKRSPLSNFLSGLAAQSVTFLILMAAFYNHSLMLEAVGLVVGGDAYGATGWA
ncbi:hypothetical protein HK44_004325 [Pseudomonas fluorescens HK44]|uniref:Uncharacterized protein n=1 Tax=Pseudomonas fluorescens HK44 TaxID=1042209 RepID=A0A010SSW8_PSEFL|nr:hypothetical protein [Pseudomonas fluorescens]EXF94078.1 hypothetical protein HK44_004325 [Pseudomonas fluorescens HK44]